MFCFNEFAFTVQVKHKINSIQFFVFILISWTHRGLTKFRHGKSSVYGWYPQLVRGRFVYDTYRTIKATRSRRGWVCMFITHCPIVTLQLHNFDLFRTCRTSSFCTVVWQLARFQLTRRIARSLGDSWASCLCIHVAVRICSRSCYLLSFIDIFA